MSNVVYIKKVENYDDILKRKHTKFPIFLKKILFLYKTFFNVVTKKKVEDTNTI